jgi:hypothetical protein
MSILMRLFAILMLALAAAPAHAATELGTGICETSTTTGTGTLTLAGAYTTNITYLSFASQITSGNTVAYTIESSNGKFEHGDGVFTDAASDTLTRVAAWSSDGAGAELTLPVGTHIVCLQPGEETTGDGDKGDITTSEGFRTWAIDANAVALTTDTTGNYVASASTTTDGLDGSCSSEGCALSLTFDPTEIGTTTWASGSGFVWTFDAGATDPTIGFSSGFVELGAAYLAFDDERGLADASNDPILKIIDGGGSQDYWFELNHHNSNGVEIKAESSLASASVLFYSKGGGVFDFINEDTTNDYPIFTFIGQSNGVGGPMIQLTHHGASPANGDEPGSIEFHGNNSLGVGNEVGYAAIYSRIVDQTAGNVDGALDIYATKAGTQYTKEMEIYDGVVIGGTASPPGTGNLIADGDLQSTDDLIAGDDILVSDAGVINFNAGECTITNGTATLVVDCGIGAATFADGSITLNNTTSFGNNTVGSVASIDWGSGTTASTFVCATGHCTVEGATIWDSGNDGSGSTLDADLLDGVSSAAFALDADIGTTIQAWDADLDALSSAAFSRATASTASYIRLLEDTDNGTNYVEIIAPASLAANRQCILQDSGPPIPDSCVGDGTDSEGAGSLPADPGVDAVLAWDDTEGASNWFTVHTGLDLNLTDSRLEIDLTELTLGDGIDTTATGISLDFTEINSTTFGSGTFTTLTFDAGATDPVWTYGSGTAGLTSSSLTVGNTVGLATFDDTGDSPNFQVLGTTANTSALGGVRFTNNDLPSRWWLGKSRGATIGDYTIVQSGDDVAQINAVASDGTNLEPVGGILFEVDGTPGDNDMPGSMTFMTTSDAAAIATGRWTITSTGTLQPFADGSYDIGTTALGVNNQHFDTGATINFENGDCILTHASNSLALTGSCVLTSDSTLDLSGVTTATLTASGANLLVEGSVVKKVGRQTIPLVAGAGTLPSGGAIAACTAVSAFDSGTNDVFLRQCSFSASADNAIYYTFFFPKAATESTDLVAQVDWTSATTTDTTDDVIWTASAVCFSNDDAINGNAFPAVDTVTDTQTAAGDYLVSGEITAITPAGTPAEGDGCVIRFTRDADAAGDNFNGTAELIQVRLYYTDSGANDG